MEVPKSAKNRIGRVQDNNPGRPASKFDFTRNLGFWQKYLSQRKAELRPEIPSNREMAEKKGHRKSSSNNFTVSHVVGARPAKTSHVRSITSYNAVCDAKARASKEELDVDEQKLYKDVRKQVTSVGKSRNYASSNLSLSKPQSGRKLLSTTQKNQTKQTKKVNSLAVADFFKKPTRAANAETRRPRLAPDNFKSFTDTRKAPSLGGGERLKGWSRECKPSSKNEVVINNNINIQPNPSFKENSFSGNIKISIDFDYSKNGNKEGRAWLSQHKIAKEASASNLYEKKLLSGGKGGFFNKKSSIIQLEEQRAPKEVELISKVRSNCVSPTYDCYHKRMASETGLQAKKLVFNLNIDMQKQATNKSNKPGKAKASLNAKPDQKRKLDIFSKNTIATKRNPKAKLGHRRNVLSLPGTSLSSFLTNLKVPIQLENQKGISMTPDLSAAKEKKPAKRKAEGRVRLSTSQSKKIIVSYSRISEEDNEDGGVESRGNSVRERPNVQAESKDSSKSSDLSLQSYISRSNDDTTAVHQFKELCNSDKTYLYKLNTNLHKQRKLLIAKIKEESKISDEVPPTGLEYYHIEKLLGEGSYGKVYRATSVLSSASVAIKCYERAKIKSETTCHRIMQEIEILKYTAHPNIIRLYEIFENQKYIFMVIEYVDSGDLLNYLKRNGVFEEEDFLSILKQVVRALAYLHSSGILHRDVKLDNILIDSNGQVKICDFGVSRKMPKTELVHEHIGTPAYLAPEIVANKGYRGFAADVWSLGVMTYIALTGQVPFKGNKIEELHDSILTHEVAFEDDCRLSPQMQTAIRGMLEKDPKRRLSLAAVAECCGFRVGGFERLETEFTNQEKIARIRAMGYAEHQVLETLEKEDINHVYALYRLMEHQGQATISNP